jgi:hypothetical protein
MAVLQAGPMLSSGIVKNSDKSGGASLFPTM